MLDRHSSAPHAVHQDHVDLGVGEVMACKNNPHSVAGKSRDFSVGQSN